jgi:hypothetical protein
MEFKVNDKVRIVRDTTFNDRESRRKPLPLGMGSRRGKYKMIK